MSGGQLTVPMVVRTQGGAGGAAQHSQSLESWLTHVPGLKVVMPSRAVDVAGLLAASIRDPNPVVVIENKTLYFRREEVPDELPAVELGVAATLREGRDVTIVALSRLVHDALAAAEALAAEDRIEAEVIDLRTLVLLDLAAIVESVQRTSRLVVAHEAVAQGGFEPIAAQVQSAAFTPRCAGRADRRAVRTGPPSAPLRTPTYPVQTTSSRPCERSSRRRERADRRRAVERSRGAAGQSPGAGSGVKVFCRGKDDVVPHREPGPIDPGG